MLTKPSLHNPFILMCLVYLLVLFTRQTRDPRKRTSCRVENNYCIFVNDATEENFKICLFYIPTEFGDMALRAPFSLANQRARVRMPLVSHIEHTSRIRRLCTFPLSSQLYISLEAESAMTFENCSKKPHSVTKCQILFSGTCVLFRTTTGPKANKSNEAHTGMKGN